MGFICWSKQKQKFKIYERFIKHMDIGVNFFVDVIFVL